MSARIEKIKNNARNNSDNFTRYSDHKDYYVNLYAKLVTEYEFDESTSLVLNLGNSKSKKIMVPTYAYNKVDHYVNVRILGEYGPGLDDELLIVMPPYIQDESNYLKLTERELTQAMRKP